MSSETARLLFAAISIDTTLPKQHRGQRQVAANQQADNDEVPQIEDMVNNNNINHANIAANLVTVSTQAYQNNKLGK